MFPGWRERVADWLLEECARSSGGVFATRNGTALDAGNVRRAFRNVVRKAGLEAENWTPREMRHSFVSLLSDSGMPIENISRLVGHGKSLI
ncbi:tyrosine-type recombinase/integrase [Actinopolymorpha alba]|uniref:tyrosine-type recombinase/integrase n=1 Tax=Actinopolymorpha alba TaxID=533267 RepID=UPI003B51475F